MNSLLLVTPESTGATVCTVPTQHAYRSGIADVEFESDNPPLFGPHDNEGMVLEIILFEKCLI
jgi:hypothetical protein